MGAVLALAAVVNTGQPATTNLPDLPRHSPMREVSEVKPVGSTLEEVALWNGSRLAVQPGTQIVMAAELPTTTQATSSDKRLDQPKARIAQRATVAASVAPAIGSSAVEAAVRAYFADIPIMIQIARCESRFRQYGSDGNVLRGKVNSLDRGVMQINEYYHLDTARKLGYDILTLEGNMAYARYLYNQKGTQPWVSSAPCWAGGGPAAEIAQR